MIGLRFKINDIILHTCESKICFKDEDIGIEPRLVNLLSYFAKHPDTVFSRTELIQAVWGNAVVTEQVVTQSVFELRKILSEHGCTDIIVTVPKRGYKLNAQVEQLATDELNCECEASDLEDLSDNFPPAVSFPAAPLTRVLNNSHSVSLASPETNKNKLSLKLFDLFILLGLVLIIGYLAFYQAKDQAQPEFDTQLITINSQVITNSPDDMGLISYGVSKQLQMFIQQFSQYRTRYTNGRSSYAGKQLTLSITPNKDKASLISVLHSQTGDKDLYASQNLITNENLAKVIQREIIDVLGALQIPLSQKDKQFICEQIGSNSWQLKQRLLAQYYIHQTDPAEIKTGIRLLNKVLLAYPHDGQALAYRFIAYAQMRLLSEQTQTDDTLISYGQAAVAYLAKNPQCNLSLLWEAKALYAIYDNKLAMAQRALDKAKEINTDYSALGYIILNQLTKNTDPSFAKDALSQAYYLDPSKHTFLLEKHLANLAG